MVSSSKEKFKTQSSKNSKQMYTFLPKFTSDISTDPSHFKKINWLPVSDRVEYSIVNTIFKYWNAIVPGYIFMKCLSLYSADIVQNYR